LYRHYYKARHAAGRDDLRWHDLRHSGAVLAAQSGATLAELMARLGHSTPAAAMRYQHAADGRDRAVAAAMSTLV
jgi:integrase